MGIFDIALVIVICGFTFYGLFFGLIKTFGSLVALTAGILIATHFYQLAFKLISSYIPPTFYLRIIIYIAIFTIVNRLVVLIFYFLNKIFNIIAIIPFLKSINRLAGALFGLLEGLFIIGLILYVIRHTGYFNSWLGRQLSASAFAPYIQSVMKIFDSYFPDFFSKLVSLF
jgi:uncharacterized membrane protein required for colicin V production